MQTPLPMSALHSAGAAMPIGSRARAWLAGGRRMPWYVTLAGLLLLALAVYLPALLRAQFLDFDDNLFFGPDNPEFRAGLWAVLDPRTTIANVYLPVAHGSLYLDWWLFGQQPLGPHLVSLLLHVLAAFTCVRWLQAMTIAELVANLAGVLFLLHPALCESVAWVSSRKDVLSGLFTFLVLLHTAKLARQPGLGRTALIAGFGVLAMYSKPTAVVLPLLALLVCLYCRGSGASARRYLAPLVLALVVAPIAWHHQAIAVHEGTMAGNGGGSLGHRLAQVPGALLHYLQQTFWPHGLNVLYPEVQTLAVFRGQVVLGSVVLAAMLLLAVWWWRTERLRPAAFGVLLLLLALLPFNTAFPASAIAAADRYLYLGLPGAALAVAVLVTRLARTGAVVGMAAALALGLCAGGRAFAFQDSATLWRASLAVDADNATAQINLAGELARLRPGELAAPRQALERAVAAARYPIHELRARRALVELSLRDAHYEEAALQARGAVQAAEHLVATETTDRRQAQAQNWLVDTLLFAFQPLRLGGDQDGAAAAFRRARQLAPQELRVIAFDALLQLQPVEQELQQAAAKGLPMMLAGDDPRALAADALLQPALQQFPDHYELNYAAGRWQVVRDQGIAAIKYFRRAIAGLRPDAASTDAFLAAAQVCRVRNFRPSCRSPRSARRSPRQYRPIRS